METSLGKIEVRNITPKKTGKDKTIVDQIGGQLPSSQKNARIALFGAVRWQWRGLGAQGKLLVPPSEHTGDNSQTLRKGTGLLCWRRDRSPLS